MKRVLMVLALAAILSAGTVFADHPDGFGIGIASGTGFTEGVNAALSLHIPNLPIFWTVRVDGFTDNLSLYVSGDYYLIHKPLVSDWLHWYLGLGGYGKIGLGDPFGLAIGGRLPVGLSFQPKPFLEIFIEASGSIGLGVLPDPVYLDWDVGGVLGIRFWF